MPPMATPAPHTVPVLWSIRTVTAGGRAIPVGRLRLRLIFPPVQPGAHLLAERCWLDTGAPLSVIPFHVHHQRLRWRPLGVQSSWAGQPCELGEIDVWLPSRRAGKARGPLPMLAKFATSDPPGDRVPVLLGLEFFLAHRASLECRPPPRQGSIEVP